MVETEGLKNENGGSFTVVVFGGYGDLRNVKRKEGVSLR